MEKIARAIAYVIMIPAIALVVSIAAFFFPMTVVLAALGACWYFIDKHTRIIVDNDIFVLGYVFSAIIFVWATGVFFQPIWWGLFGFCLPGLGNCG